MLGANARIWTGSFGGEQLFRIVKYPGGDYKLYANYGRDNSDNLLHSVSTSLKLAKNAARDSNLAKEKIANRKHIIWKAI